MVWDCKPVWIHSRSQVNLLLLLWTNLGPRFRSFRWSRFKTKSLRAPLHETRSELKPIWNIKLLWKVVSFTWQFHYEQPWNLKPLSKTVQFIWRFHFGNFLNHSKTLLHTCKWYFLINASFIDAKRMLQYWLFFQQ